MKYFSLCPTRLEPSGHGAIYHLCFHKAIQKLGSSHELFMTVDSKPETHSWVPFFKKRRWYEFSKIFLKKSKEPRTFFIESFTTKDFISLTLAVLFFRKKNDRFWILFRYGLTQLRFSGKIHLFCLKLLKGKYIGFTDSEKIRENFAPYIHLHLLPIPHIDFKPQKNEMRKPYRCWWPGQPKAAKGLQEIQRLASKYHKDFQLLLSKDTPLKSFNADIHFLPPVLTRTEYCSQLLASDLILLPYDPKVYRYGTSGIFVEGVVAGKIPFVKEGSWLAAELKRYGLNELIIDWEEENLFGLLLRKVESPELFKKLAKMQREYVDFHSIDSYVSHLARVI